MRLLTFSTLYPNAAAPTHGVFVENRLRHLVGTGAVTSTVLAPVPWFPSQNARFGAWARHAAAPAEETRHGLRVLHPRFLAIPRVGMSASPYLLYASAARAVARLMREGAVFDAIDAHYLYPDGVAATWLGRRFGLPVVMTARGSDVTQLPAYAWPRRLILRAAQDAAAIVTVSAGLHDALRDLGVAPGKMTVLRNGVDLTLFRPLDRVAARAALGLVRPTLVSVGALIARKGHDRTIAAMQHLPEWELMIVGDGPLRAALQSQAARCGVADRVHFMGAQAHESLPQFYAAADISVLASSREGWANVLLESMACGTPVVASPIPGNTEVVRAPEAGLLMRENSAACLAEAVYTLSFDLPHRARTTAYAARFGWAETSAGQLALFRDVIAARR
jgi:glycosyltransferase involved in cell wall biosynthesis